jgi:protein-disulfide isomerase
LVKPISVLFALACLAFADPSSDKSLGSRSAPILIDLFSDFQCPSCKALHDQTLPSVITDYVNKGKVLLVYHDYPLPMHSHAREAARWANAAAAVHKYRQVGDAFFENQDTWARTGDLRSVVAKVLTPDEMLKVDALMKDPKFDDGLTRDVALGTRAGVQGTPTMIVTHKLQNYPITRFVSYPIMKQMLDELAAK